MSYDVILNLSGQLAYAGRQPTINVVFIHGTWSNRGIWTHPKPYLRRCLEEIRGVRCVAFSWSGGNRHRDRVAAGFELEKFMQRQIDTYPNATHIIVAHSHGGNVALYSLRNRAILDHVDGVICLATPFIHVTPRSLRDPTLEKVSFTPFFLSSVWLFARPSLISGAVYAFVLVGLIIQQLTEKKRVYRRRQKIQQVLGVPVSAVSNPAVWAQTVAGAIALPSLPPERLRIVRFPADEAALAIAAAQFGTWLLEQFMVLTRRFRRSPVGVKEDLWEMAVFSVALGAITLPLSVIWLLQTSSRPDVWDDPMIIVGVGLVALIGLLAACLACLQISLGPEGLWWALDLRVTAESGPPGTYQVTHAIVPKGAGTADDVDNFLHSRVYNSREVAEDISRWVVQRSRVRASLDLPPDGTVNHEAFSESV